MNKKRRALLVEIISALFILLFVYAASSKILDFQKFRIELGKSPMLGFFSTYVSITIPVLEIMISILLIIRRYQYIALFASFSLMVVFSFYIIFILKFSSYIPCTCGGILENMSWSQHLIFNVGFILLGIVAILFYPTKNLSAVRG